MNSYVHPRPLLADDNVAGFSCGDSSLDEWLRKRAAANEAGHATRTYVTCATDAPGVVIGYYALAAGSISAHEVPGRMRRNMPKSIPVVILARLAVDVRCQRHGLGAALLKDAIPRVIAAGEHIGIRAMLIHALNEKAASFYAKLGFTPALPGGLTYVATVDDLAKTLLG